MVENDQVRTYLKVRAHRGGELVYERDFKLCVASGPSYDILMSVENSNDRVQ